MKTVVINASPRRRWNTAQVMKEAAKGAESAGAEVEYVDLYKKADKDRCKCYWKDELSPLIERILDADTLLIGSPIYFNEPTSHYRALMERLIFCILSYDGFGSYFEGKINVGLFFTMNAPEDYYETMMEEYLESSSQVFGMLNGEVKIYPVFNTLQVNDYSKYAMGAFDEEDKKLNHEKQFPVDLKKAFEIGAELSK